MGPRCNLRYETYRFYEQPPDAPPPSPSDGTSGNSMQLNLPTLNIARIIIYLLCLYVNNGTMHWKNLTVV